MWVIFGPVTRILIAATSLAVPLVAQATDYYVSSSIGADTNSGTASNRPWRTLAKVNAGSYRPGDRVLFRCGDLWREQLVVSSSGVAGSPITFTQYGSDCNGNNKPAITGADPVTGWTVHRGSIYSAPATLLRQSQNLIENGSMDINPQMKPDKTGDTWWHHGRGSAPRWTEADCVSGGCLQFEGGKIGAVLATKRFALIPGTDYRLDLRMRADNRVVVGARLYRGTMQAAPVVDGRFNVGTIWNSYSLVLTTPPYISTHENARVDFWVSSSSTARGSGTTVSIDDVSLVPVSNLYDTAKQVFVNGRHANLAQHPNPVPGDATDTWLKIAKSQSVICKRPATGTNTMVTIPDSAMSANADDLVGAGIHIRSTDWIIEDQMVTAYDDARKSFSFGCLSATHGAQEGWGYYLDDKLWMLDSPGEWYYDPASAQLFAWMPDGGAPGARVEVGHRDYGIDARHRAFVVIDGLRVEKTGTGVILSNTSSVILRNCATADSGEYGINAAHSSSAVISNCDVINSARTGIYGPDAAGVAVIGNRVTNSGNIGSPLASEAGIYAGSTKGDALIERNSVHNTGYNGIFPWKRAIVRWNLVEYACLVLNDCGGIYSGGDNGSPIIGNVIRHVFGNTNGSPAGRAVLANGIYLDDWARKYTVANNTIVDAVWGLHAHNASNNTFSQNTIYGTREWPVRVQEDTTASVGTSHRNFFVGNLLYPTSVVGTYYLSSDFAWNKFASYGNNRYSSLYSATLINEKMQKQNGEFSVHNFFTLGQWRLQRGHDRGSTTFAPFRIAAERVLRVNSPNLVTNAEFDANVSGWEKWNRNPPTNTSNAMIGWRAGCLSGGGCLRFTAGTTQSLLYTASKISIQKDRSYRVRVDLRGQHSGQLANIAVLRAGPASYDNLGIHKRISVGTKWESHSWVFKARGGAVVSNATAQKGARLQIDISAGQIIEIDNVRLEEVTAEYNDPVDDSAILINDDGAGARALPCPDSATNPTKCAQYIDFPSGNPTKWPKTVSAMGSAIVVWIANPFRDSDFDGIADSHDHCANTATDVTTDERGCAFVHTTGRP